MNKNYACPYCGQDSYAKSSKKSGLYESWDSVIKHTSRCEKIDNSFLIDNTYGPISVEELNRLTAKELKQKYKNIKFTGKKKTLKKYLVKSFKVLWDKTTIISAIQDFKIKYNRIPGIRDFGSKNPDYPNHDTVKTHFGSWNAAIEASGLVPNIQNGFGINTIGLDGHLYRSRAEAYFADTYLYNKYDYVIELKYPKPYNRYYDWFIPSLDLYIELDGGIRPQVREEKELINRLLNRKCLFIDTSLIYSNFDCSVFTNKMPS